VCVEIFFGAVVIRDWENIFLGAKPADKNFLPADHLSIFMLNLFLNIVA
jgi:hypothetical protein